MLRIYQKVLIVLLHLKDLFKYSIHDSTKGKINCPFDFVSVKFMN